MRLLNFLAVGELFDNGHMVRYPQLFLVFPATRTHSNFRYFDKKAKESIDLGDFLLVIYPTSPVQSLPPVYVPQSIEAL